MLVTGKQFIYIYTPESTTHSIARVVRAICKRIDLSEIDRNVYFEIPDIETLYSEIEVPANDILAISKVTFKSANNFKEQDFEEQFSELLLDYFVQQYYTLEDVESEIPSVCKRTKAYQVFMHDCDQAEQYRKEQQQLRQWYQAVSL